MELLFILFIVAVFVLTEFSFFVEYVAHLIVKDLKEKRIL